jgi:hypothetical protein
MLNREAISHVVCPETNKAEWNASNKTDAIQPITTTSNDGNVNMFTLNHPNIPVADCNELLQ